MSIKAKIIADFNEARKNKDTLKVETLNILKAKITEGEKANKNQELTNPQIVKILTLAAKQRNEAAEAYTKGDRIDLATKEYAEQTIITAYLPELMSEEEITAHVESFFRETYQMNLSQDAVIGKTMGAFNKAFPGQADGVKLKEIVTQVLLETFLSEPAPALGHA